MLLRVLSAVVASEKGVVVGRLRFTEDGDPIDCSRMGVGGKAIPPNVDKVRPFNCPGNTCPFAGTFLRLLQSKCITSRTWYASSFTCQTGFDTSMHAGEWGSKRCPLHTAGGERRSVHAPGRGQVLPDLSLHHPDS